MSAALCLEKLGKTKVSKGTLSLASSPIAGMDVNTVIGVTGDILGQVIFSMSTDTAQKLASVMLMGLPLVISMRSQRAPSVSSVTLLPETPQPNWVITVFVVILLLPLYLWEKKLKFQLKIYKFY